MVSEDKKTEVEYLKKLMIKYKVISVGDITSLPSKQFQEIRKKLKDKVVIKVTKKRLIKRAIESIKEKECPSCHRILPVSKFYESNSHKDGLSFYCKECELQNQKRFDFGQ